MRIFYTLSTNGLLFSMTTLSMWKLSLALTKKHYGNDCSIELVCDNSGYEILQNLDFDEFHIELNNITYPTLWSLGKIYSYKYICSLDEPFLHLDADVFLWEKLSDTLTNSNIFCQSKDFSIGQGIYDLLKLQHYTGSIIPIEWTNNIGVMSYNLGIFGGSDLVKIDQYTNFVLDMIHNPMYQNLWNSNPLIPIQDGFNISSAKSCLIEQANFGVFCHQNNIEPNLLFEEHDDPEHLTYKKYTHLIQAKYNHNIINNINNRVSSIPYNLSPKNVPKEEWNNIYYEETEE